jgi:hypothetical protein
MSSFPMTAGSSSIDNNLVADRQLLRVAVARVPEDASPISGSYVGPAGAFLGLGVGVAITPAERLG